MVRSRSALPALISLAALAACSDAPPAAALKTTGSTYTHESRNGVAVVLFPAFTILYRGVPAAEGRGMGSIRTAGPGCSSGGVAGGVACPGEPLPMCEVPGGRQEEFASRAAASGKLTVSVPSGSSVSTPERTEGPCVRVMSRYENGVATLRVNQYDVLVKNDGTILEVAGKSFPVSTLEKNTLVIDQDGTAHVDSGR